MQPTNTSTSIVDLLKSQGKSSDFKSRAGLATEMGISKDPTSYTGSADENIALINAIKGMATTSKTTTAPTGGQPNVQQNQQAPVNSPNYNPNQTPTTTSPDTKGLTSNVVDLLKGNTTSKFNTSDPNTPEGKERLKIEESTRSSALASQRAQEAQYDIQKQQELDAFETGSKQRISTLRNSLALRGTLGTSTQADQKIQEQELLEEKARGMINNKYEVLKLDLDAKTKSSITEQIDKKLKQMVDEFELNSNLMNEDRQFGLDIFKELNDQDYKQKQLQLDKEIAEATRLYNQGKLSIDAYQASIQAYNAETSRMKVDNDIAGGFKFDDETRAALLGSGLNESKIIGLQNSIKSGGLNDETKKGLNEQQLAVVERSMTPNKPTITRESLKSLFGNDDAIKQSIIDSGQKDKYKKGWFGVDTEKYLDDAMSTIEMYRKAGMSDEEILKQMKG